MLSGERRNSTKFKHRITLLCGQELKTPLESSAVANPKKSYGMIEENEEYTKKD